MNVRHILGVLIAIALCAGLALAQNQPQAKKRAGKKRAAAANPMEAQPSPEIRKLIGLVQGNWRVDEKHEAMGPTIPAGTGTGLATFHRGPGGLSIVENARIRLGQGGLVGLGIISWDPKDQLYKAYWCDNWSPNGCQPSGTGKWEGDKLILTSETEQDGKKMSIRETYSDFTPDAFNWTMEMGESGGQLNQVMAIKYSRSKPAEAAPAVQPAQPKP